MTHGRSVALALAAWSLLFAAAAGLILSKQDASMLGAEYIPFGYDSFYHAKRILAVAAGQPLIQFDPLINVPAGSWIPWPWAYDWVLGQSVRLAGWVAPSTSPMQRLAFVPLAGLGLTLALLMATAREMRVSWPVALFAAASFVLSPQVVSNHLLGAVDHHGAEATAFLLALWTGLRWHRRKDVSSAAWHAAAIALAPGVQNALFLLQAFSLAALAVSWWRGELPKMRSLSAFAITLAAATLLLLLPSEPFRRGWTEFYFLGVFHAMAAASTAGFALLLGRASRDAKGFALLAAYVLAVLAVFAVQLLRGSSFIAADNDALGHIQETANAWEVLANDGVLAYLVTNTPLPLLAPFALVFAAWLRRHDGAMAWFLPYAAAGCAMFLLQLRFWPYGLAASMLAAALVIDALLARSREPAWAKSVVVLLLTVATLAAPARDFDSKYPVAGSSWFASLREVLPPLRNLCNDAPHVVLADPNYGHFISYFSGCAVLANNFIMVANDYATRARAERLFSMDPESFLAEARDIDFVVADVHPGRLRELRGTGRLHAGDETPALKQRLLDNNQPVPRGFELVVESNLTVLGGSYAVMRILKNTDAPHDAP